MEKRYFTKTVHGCWDQERNFVRYIATPDEWENVKILCDIMSKKDDEMIKRISESIIKFSRQYIKKYDTEPDMPEGSMSFILFDNEANLFDEICLNIVFNK